MRLITIFLALIYCFAPALNIYAQEQKESGVITGRVVGENNEPLAGVTVSVQQPGAFGGGGGRSDLTDDEGRFKIDNLPASAYTLGLLYPGYISEEFANNTSFERTYYRPGDTANIRMLRGGVITGKVTDKNGEPVVGVGVRVIRVRDIEGKAVGALGGFGQPRRTDDRGIYRYYGLLPGYYIVHAGGSRLNFQLPTQFDNDAPTYYPSGKRADAVEVKVTAGEEKTDIDISYRAEPGYKIRGNVAGVLKIGEEATGINVQLINRDSGTTEAFTTVDNRAGRTDFTFKGIGDGEYNLEASIFSGKENGAYSNPVRVTVKGKDVEGVTVNLALLGSISGQLVLEPLKTPPAPPGEKKPECKPSGPNLIDETIVRIAKPERAELLPARFLQQDLLSDDKGNFTSRNLQPGQYHVILKMPDESCYLRALTMSGSAGAKQPTDLSRTGIPLKGGEKVSGVQVVLAEGAAALRGLVVSAQEGQALPLRMRVHLIPAEREQADNILRYKEVKVGPDGVLTITNIAPGRYLLMARAIESSEPLTRTHQLVAWDAAERAKLRAEAEKLNNAVELKQCQQINDFVLRYTPTKGK